jgi:aryl-alcohol dehydrogenase-like predicted oxidoreductase
MRYTTIGSGSSSARKVSVLSLGAMRFGTMTDEATSFAILDRYVAAGGNWLIGGDLPVVPLIGASSVAQLDESLAAVDLQLSPQQRQLLDAAD